jgi:general secretion pathway protein F
MKYRVRALSETGRIQLYISAPTPEQAGIIVAEQGFTVLDVRPKFWLEPLLYTANSRFPLLLFTKELLTLLSSGLPLLEILLVLEERETQPFNRQIIQGVREHLRQGESLSAALSHHPDVFPAIYIASVRASEQSGDLVPALERFVAWKAQLDAVRQRVLSASLYPILLLALGGLVTLFLLGYVTPRFAGIYGDNIARLPWASRQLILLGGWIEGNGVLSGAVFLGGMVFGAWALARPGFRAYLLRQVWRIPALGERLRIFQLARFYRTMGMLLAGGTPILQALEMSSGLLAEGLKPRVLDASQRIRAGAPISDAFQEAGLSTSVASRLLRVGEQSGRMGEMMENTATFHDEDIERFLERFTRLFEPLLMAVIGGLVGLIVVLLYLPIFELAGNLD